MSVSYPYCTSTVTNHTHGLEKQNKTTTTQLSFLFEHFLTFLLKETWRDQAMRREVQLVFISTTMLSCLWNSSSYCETPHPSKCGGCRSHAIWLARKSKVMWLSRGYSKYWKQPPSHTINTLYICWNILRRQAGFCCRWLISAWKSIPFETSWGTTGYTTSWSRKWPYRVNELAAGELLWFKAQYFYPRSSCNTASTGASQS